MPGSKISNAAEVTFAAFDTLECKEGEEDHMKVEKTRQG